MLGLHNCVCRKLVQHLKIKSLSSLSLAVRFVKNFQTEGLGRHKKILPLHTAAIGYSGTVFTTRFPVEVECFVTKVFCFCFFSQRERM